MHLGKSAVKSIQYRFVNLNTKYMPGIVLERENSPIKGILHAVQQRKTRKQSNAIKCSCCKDRSVWKLELGTHEINQSLQQKRQF